MASLYIHIPYCRRLCGYCDFFKTMDLRGMDGYPARVVEEMHHRQNLIGEGPLDSIYIGGGTPSLFSPDQLNILVEEAFRIWGISPGAEITLEANPDDVTDQFADSLRGTMFNRVSIGIQSFDDGDLSVMGRRHDAKGAVKAVERLQKAGIDNISGDLIYGLPCSSPEIWESNISMMMSLGIGHISAYHLSIEPGTPFYVKHMSDVDDTLSEREYLTLHRRLTEAGYEHYEISNFALPGLRSRHNSAYWTGAPYLGLGPGAHSYDGQLTRSAVVRDVPAYLRGEFRYEEDVLSDTDLYNETVMLSLRTAEGVDLEAMRLRFGPERTEAFLHGCRRFEDSGVLRREGGRMRINPERWLVSDDVISSLFEA